MRIMFTQNFLSYKIRLQVCCIALFLFITFTGKTQSTGDYQSANTTGTWATATDWQVYNGSSWITASSAPLTTSNVTIQSGHTMTVTTSGTTNCNNLTVAGTLVSSSATTSPLFINVYGTTITNNNLIGNTSRTDGISFNLYNTSMILTGSGATYVDVIQPSIDNVSFTFASSAVLCFSGLTVGSGGVSLYANGKNGVSFTINAGKIISTVAAGYVGIGASGTSDATTGGNTTFNINGTLTTGTGGIINLRNAGTKTTAFNVGATGIVNCGGNLNAPSGSGGAINVNVSSGGTVNFLNASSTCDITAATTTMNGTWNFANTSTSSRSIGTASVGGKLRFPDNTFPTGITLGTGSTVQYDGVGAITLASSAPTTFYNLLINNANSVTLFNSINIYTSLSVSTGQLKLANNTVTLKSTSAYSSARVDASVGTPFTYGASGSFIVERFIPGKRAFRFLAHPLNSSIALNQLTSVIDITGNTTGATTGATPCTGCAITATNAPSAFWYNTATGDGNTTNDAGWNAFTDLTQTTGTNAWNQYQGIRVLVRGALNQGLDGNTYTPSNVVLKTAGQLSDAGSDITENLTYAGAAYNLVGNPYASQVDLSSISYSNVGTNYWVWDPTLSTRGAYVNGTTGNTFGSAYILPSGGAFFVKTTGISPSITFPQISKVSTVPSVGFRTVGTKNTVQLQLSTDSISWDRILFYFDANAKAGSDNIDGAKFSNPDVNFYSINNDKQNVSIDARPAIDNDVIPLGIQTSTARTFTIKIADYDLPAGTELWLHDKYMNTMQKLEKDGTFTFSTNSDVSSQGEDRLELVQKVAPMPIVNTNFIVQLSPNPATDKVIVSFNNGQQIKTNIIITNTSGQTMRNVYAGDLQNGQVTIDVKGLAKGVYYVSLNGKNTQKLVVE